MGWAEKTCTHEKCAIRTQTKNYTSGSHLLHSRCFEQLNITLESYASASKKKKT